MARRLPAGPSMTSIPGMASAATRPTLTIAAPTPRGAAHGGTELSRADRCELPPAAGARSASFPLWRPQNHKNPPANDFDKAAAIEKPSQDAIRLHSGAAAHRPLKDPIANFLFERKARPIASTSLPPWRSCCAPWRFPRRVGQWISAPTSSTTLPENYVVRAKRRAFVGGKRTFPAMAGRPSTPTPGGRQRNAARLGPPGAVRRRHVVVLA